MRDFLGRDGTDRAREAALTLTAVLLSFGSAYALRRTAGLTASVEVLAVAGTVWVRRFGERARRLATFVLLPVISVLIVPGVAVVGSGASRWWSALVALIVFAWVTLVGRAGARLRWRGHGDLVVVPARAAPRPRRDGDSRFRLLGSTKMALQMGMALAAGFGLGRWLYAPHWSWCVLRG